jgi:hypothetical protein
MKTLPLTKGLHALVDDGDFDFLNQWKWTAYGRFPKCYAARRVERKGIDRLVFMHREIADAKEGEDIDHIDTDSLNNQRYNLRRCTQSQNNANQPMSKSNTSGFKGVSLNKRDGKWWASIRVNRRLIHLGRFPSPKDAALAYDEAALRLRGEFARTNRMLGLL